MSGIDFKKALDCGGRGFHGASWTGRRKRKIYAWNLRNNSNSYTRYYNCCHCGRVFTKDYYILAYKNLTTSTISESELMEYFNSCDFKVVKI